ncbi:MFS general substrate transporter [Aulographum hederae CBS 113979]|uniref:MFS general substrate transporter n=1 Tax=Aulographum hederae CBS 113979 TaxID=1176131 RepID=A0A6G1HC74_9PEZI|nr:MFS general substrate transporter [Aulographum hederae CBS 113979]
MTDMQASNPPCDAEKRNAEEVIEASNDENAEQKPPRQIQGLKWALTYVAMLSTTFLFSLDNTIVADIQPSILTSFPGQTQLLPWIGVAFALGSMSVLPWGKTYGVFNIKYIYLFNIVLFEVGSALCGASQNMTMLIIARVITGIGGSGMYSGTMNYVSVLTTMEERAAYMSGNAVLWGIGSVLGPVVGGVFATSSATWRWSFYINLVVGAVFAPVYVLLLPNIDPQHTFSLQIKLLRIDWLTTIVFLAGSACFTMAISFGGTVYAWTSGTEIALWAVTGALLLITIALLVWHPAVAKDDRLYPLHFLKQPMLVNLQLQIFLSSGILFTMTYYIPLYFQFSRSDGPLDAGIRLLPFIAVMVTFSLLNGFLMPKLPYVILWHLFGSGLTLIGSALMYTVTARTPTAPIYGYTILIGAGCGSYIVAGLTIIQSLLPAAEIPNAVAAITIAQDLGMTLFLSIGGTLYQNLAIRDIRVALPGLWEGEVEELVAGTSSAAFKALGEEERGRVVEEIAGAMGGVWALFIAGAALSFLMSFGMGKTKMATSKKKTEA